MRIKRIATAISSVAELVMRNGAEGIPVVIVKGLSYEKDENATAKELNMRKEKWLFK